MNQHAGSQGQTDTRYRYLVTSGSLKSCHNCDTSVKSDPHHARRRGGSAWVRLMTLGFPFPNTIPPSSRGGLHVTTVSTRHVSDIEESYNFGQMCVPGNDIRQSVCLFVGQSPTRIALPKSGSVGALIETDNVACWGTSFSDRCTSIVICLF